MTATVPSSPPLGRGVLRATLIFGAVGVVACGAGCLGPLDRSIQDLVTKKSREMNAVPVKERDWAAEDVPERSSTQFNTDPGTNNPSATSLTYAPADPDRDPMIKLVEYARRAAGVDPEEDVRRLTLADAWRISQSTARSYMSAEEDYIFAAIRLLIERHQWGPRFFDDLSTVLAGGLTDGENEAAVNVINDLRVTQRLPYGGSVEAAWIWRATEQLRDQASGQYTQSSDLVFSGNIPLLRGAGQSARESLIQSERDLVYAARNFERFRREFFVRVAEDYFSLLEQQASISNTKRRLITLHGFLNQTRWEYNSGLRTIVDVNNAENSMLATRQDLDDRRERYMTALDRFKIDLGIPVEEFIDVVPLVFDLSEPDISLQESTARALALRLDIQNERDQLDDARRDVFIARNQLLPSLDLNGNVSIPTDPDEDVGGLDFDPNNLDYSVGITFGLPLDRKEERLRLRQAIIGLQRDARNLDQSEDLLILEARSSRRFIERARSNLNLAERRVELNVVRVEMQQADPGNQTTQDILDVQDDLILAQIDLDQSETALRIAILNYLLTTGQMRVSATGQFEPIPGMEFPPATLFESNQDLSLWWQDPELDPLVELIDPDEIGAGGPDVPDPIDNP